MKRYDKIACLIKNDAIMNKKVEIEYKDFMYQKMYRNKAENKDIAPLLILSNIHEKLRNTYMSYNYFEISYSINE